MKQKRRTPLPPLETGQVWQMKDTNVLIGLIGKTLVHYKHFKPAYPRAPISLAGKEILGKFLSKNKAVLLQS